MTDTRDPAPYDAHCGIDETHPAPHAIRTTLGRLIDAAVVCTVCGSAGVGSCRCWVPCPCGWLRRDGQPCRNPKHGKRHDATIATSPVGQGGRTPDGREGALERKGEAP